MWKCWSLRSSPAAPEQHVGSFQRRRRWLWRGKQLGFSENLEEPNERYFAPRERLRESEFIMVVILSGEESSLLQDLLLLDVTFLAHGYGDCRWCHDEAHLTQHHHSHDEKH